MRREHGQTDKSERYLRPVQENEPLQIVSLGDGCFYRSDGVWVDYEGNSTVRPSSFIHRTQHQEWLVENGFIETSTDI